MKIRGFRIELGEIEARLAEHDGVREAVVVAREDALGTSGWWRTVRRQRRRRESETEMLESCALLAGSLPEYMVPAAICAAGGIAADTQREAGPQGAAGSRKAMPTRVRGYEAPQGEIETRWPRSGPRCCRSSGSGGTITSSSSAATRCWPCSLMERMRRQGLQVDVRALFATPTLAGLAAGTVEQETIVEVPANRYSRRVRSDYTRDAAVD